jgi:hypothetical protein
MRWFILKSVSTALNFIASEYTTVNNDLPLQANAAIALKYGRERFLPNPFQLIIYLSPLRSTLYI